MSWFHVGSANSILINILRACFDWLVKTIQLLGIEIYIFLNVSEQNYAFLRCHNLLKKWETTSYGPRFNRCDLCF